jgi:hypothetical protein
MVGSLISKKVTGYQLQVLWMNSHNPLQLYHLKSLALKHSKNHLQLKGKKTVEPGRIDIIRSLELKDSFFLTLKKYNVVLNKLKKALKIIQVK